MSRVRATSKSRTDWLNRERALLLEVAEIVRTVRAEAEHYDTIDLMFDLPASTVTATVEEYLENECDDAYRGGVDDCLSVDPDETARSAAVHVKTDRRSFDERIEEYSAAGLDGFERKLAALVATDGHRVRSEGTMDAGEELQSVGLTVTKTGRTMLDEKVRDTHFILARATVPYDEAFEIGPFSSPTPGLFGVAELDCNCRCELELRVGENFHQ